MTHWQGLILELLLDYAIPFGILFSIWLHRTDSIFVFDETFLIWLVAVEFGGWYENA